ncbi:MAG: [FeFe] hydrogenase H-cluster radical SAM maturase HydG [Phycisphaerales bacterium]|jgi:2-iminoacetate synthase|nr:[FeFe] hydrogenase H-cluster radical SAM maturase HydG [Phycisphaerales bacterium]MBT7170455.1 [FeFe] hydrogenase H-cluster radical SAM maturase HydG [Phycisphaerales bacterium]
MDTTTLSKTATDFIDDAYLEGLIDQPTPDPAQVREIIAKALDKQPLNVEETAVLLRCDSPELIEEIFAAARELKTRVYGNRIVLFAPLYIGSYCVNDCAYCGFRRSNPDSLRRTLTKQEVVDQATALEQVGHKRLILVWGEHPWYTPESVAEVVKTIYDVKSDPHGEIRRVNINAAPLDDAGYRIVKESGIGTYQIFQETYHHETYAKVHPKNTQKGDYLWRLDGLSRAFEAGLDDVGIGALFGLADWKFDTLALVAHAVHLEKTYGCGPHTISFPRMQDASGLDLETFRLVSDDDFKRIVAILRLAVPYTGLILTARESPELRREVMAFGVSQIDAGSRIELGGYTEVGDSQVQVVEKEQFKLGDIRSLDEVVRELLTDGYVPSWCTSCYRLGRTGEHFMEFAVPGFIKRYCTPNALTTLQEYLIDYASDETIAVGNGLIDKEIQAMPESEQKTTLLTRMAEIRDTPKRDLYF